VDLLYFVDPAQDGLSPARARDLFAGRITLAGGLNSTTLQSRSPQQIRDDVRRALDALAGTGRFILQPVDALHPDTPWEGLQTALEAWRQWG
jgi:uroporphyrinogen-III decarboxylase